jgi:hypothetical protein
MRYPSRVYHYSLPLPGFVIRFYSTVAALANTFSTRHLLRALRGRVSTIRTRSPTLHTLFSSCARNFEVLRRIFLYRRCCTRLSTATATVFCICVLVTMPTWLLRIPLVCSVPILPSINSRLAIQNFRKSLAILNLKFQFIVCVPFPLKRFLHERYPAESPSSSAHFPVVR